MTARKPGELTDDEIVDAFDSASAKVGEIGRAIATAAHAKAMKRAAEVAYEATMFGMNAGEAIERESK